MNNLFLMGMGAMLDWHGRVAVRALFVTAAQICGNFCIEHGGRDDSKTQFGNGGDCFGFDHSSGLFMESLKEGFILALCCSYDDQHRHFA